MGKRNMFMAALILLAALALSVATGFRLRGQQWNFKQEISSQFQPIQNLWPDDLLSAPQANSHEFISPDDKLKITYPYDWLAVEEKEALTSLVTEPWKQKYGLEALFFAAKIQEGEPPQVVIYRGQFDMTADEIIGEIQRDNQQQGWKMTLISSKDGVFEANYQTPGGANYRSKEKILIGNDGGAYLIMALAAQESWLSIKDEVDKIIDSAILIEEK